MSVDELHALTQRFADVFDQRDLMTVMEMLSEDVKVFEHLEGVISAGFGFRQPSCRVHSDTVGIVNAYDMFVGVTKEGKARSIHGRTTLVFIKKAGVGNCERPLFCYAPGSLTMRQRHPASLEMGHEYK